MHHCTRVFVAGMIALVSGCADSHDSLAGGMVAAMKEANGVLDGVTDEASAKAAAPRLETTAARITDIQKRMEKLADLPVDKRAEFATKHLPEIASETQRMSTNVLRISASPLLAAQLGKALEAFSGSGGGPAGR